MKVKKNIAISESGFLFNPSTGDSYSVNPIGQEILKLLKEGKEDEQVIAHLLNNYMTDRIAVEKDLYDFVSMLRTYKLIENE
ncbi:MAG: PqqD family protein [Flavobacteriaceae bacterium]